jgi:hypothetical protein
MIIERNRGRKLSVSVIQDDPRIRVPILGIREIMVPVIPIMVKKRKFSHKKFRIVKDFFTPFLHEGQKRSDKDSSLPQSGQVFIMQCIIPFNLINDFFKTLKLPSVFPKYIRVYPTLTRMKGKAYQGFQLGRRTATTIFMYSFSGGAERGTTVGEIKRSATTLDNPSSVIVVAVDLLKGKLFYLQNIGDKYYFKNQPNINRIILSKIDNIKEPEIIEAEKENLKSSLKGGKFRISLWTENSAEIPDNEELKLIILHKEDKKIIEDIIKNKGGTPRVYRNTLFFLCPLESERPIYLQNLSRSIAYELVEKDKELGITEEQRREISKEHKKFQETVKECTQRLYRIVWIPGKEPFDLGIPTFGEIRGLDSKIYDDLRAVGEILERTTPLFLKTKYLSKNEYVLTEQIYQSTLKTPGEPRYVNKAILENAISDGVLNGIFGLGILENNTPKCEYYKKMPPVSLSGNEVIIVDALCREIRDESTGGITAGLSVKTGITSTATTETGSKETGGVQTFLTDTKAIRFSFTIPMGKVSNILGVMNFLTSRFKKVDITIEAQDGALSEQDYENKIKEAFEQIGVELREE